MVDAWGFGNHEARLYRGRVLRTKALVEPDQLVRLAMKRSSEGRQLNGRRPQRSI
jgi:hypothetical protein